VPEGWKVVSATSGSHLLEVDEKGTVDISSLSGKVQIAFAVKRSRI
jgi:hypothetical protein